MAQKPAFVDTQNFGLDDLFFADELTMTRPFPLHRHSFVEIHYIRGGKGNEVINGIAYPLSKGSMSLKMPWHIHEIIPDPKEPLAIAKCSFRMCVLDDNGLMQSVSSVLAQSYNYCPVAQIPAEEQEAMETVFKRIMGEQKRYHAMREEAIAALMTQIVICFLRYAKEEDEANAHTGYDLLRLINLRYREPDLTCQKVAEMVHYSESQVARILEAQFGLTFLELLREIRIRNACGLLETTDYPVESIGLWTGYHSRDGFYNAFLEERGITPAEYRTKYRTRGMGENVKALSNTQLYSRMIYELHQNYAEDITLAEMAVRFKYSECYLKKVLKEQGTSFPRLLEEIRIYHAKKELLQESQTMEAVSKAAGFASQETFYRTFKKHTDLTPTEYRRQMQVDAGISDK